VPVVVDCHVDGAGKAPASAKATVAATRSIVVVSRAVSMHGPPPGKFKGSMNYQDYSCHHPTVTHSQTSAKLDGLLRREAMPSRNQTHVNRRATNTQAHKHTGTQAHRHTGTMGDFTDFSDITAKDVDRLTPTRRNAFFDTVCRMLAYFHSQADERLATVQTCAAVAAAGRLNLGPPHDLTADVEYDMLVVGKKVEFAFKAFCVEMRNAMTQQRTGADLETKTATMARAKTWHTKVMERVCVADELLRTGDVDGCDFLVVKEEQNGYMPTAIKGNTQAHKVYMEAAHADYKCRTMMMQVVGVCIK
jgi:hypothetical protein